MVSLQIVSLKSRQSSHMKFTTLRVKTLEVPSSVAIEQGSSSSVPYHTMDFPAEREEKLPAGQAEEGGPSPRLSPKSSQHNSADSSLPSRPETPSRDTPINSPDTLRPSPPHPTTRVSSPYSLGPLPPPTPTPPRPRRFRCFSCLHPKTD